MVVGHRRVGVPVEHRKLVDVVPDFLVVGVEDVGAVAVDVDALNAFGIDIAGNVVPLVHHQAGLAGGGGFVGKDCAVQAGADNQIIVLHN